MLRNPVSPIELRLLKILKALVSPPYILDFGKAHFSRPDFPFEFIEDYEEDARSVAATVAVDSVHPLKTRHLESIRKPEEPQLTPRRLMVFR
jgi:hypothetical protein